MTRNDIQRDCSTSCRSQEHGSLITAAIIRGSEAEAIAYLRVKIITVFMWRPPRKSRLTSKSIEAIE